MCSRLHTNKWWIKDLKPGSSSHSLKATNISTLYTSRKDIEIIRSINKAVYNTRSRVWDPLVTILQLVETNLWGRRQSLEYYDVRIEFFVSHFNSITWGDSSTLVHLISSSENKNRHNNLHLIG